MMGRHSAVRIRELAAALGIDSKQAIRLAHKRRGPVRIIASIPPNRYRDHRQLLAVARTIDDSHRLLR